MKIADFIDNAKLDAGFMIYVGKEGHGFPFSEMRKCSSLQSEVRNWKVEEKADGEICIRINFY